MLKSLFWVLLHFCLGLRVFLDSPPAAAAALSSPTWDWKISPKKPDWQAFMRLQSSLQTQVWRSIEKQGLHFEQLAWEWRTAWVQICARSSSKLCSKILQLGLFDKALVVRAEAAVKMGERFAGSAHAPALRLLSTAYAVQQNKQGKEPLYVQYRILHAIKQIGGEPGLSLGKKLATTSPATARYWNRLAAPDRL